MMPITDQARKLAGEFRGQYERNNNSCHGYWTQEKSEIDGRYHWLTLSHEDMKALQRPEDLEAVCQAMLINHRIIEAADNDSESVI